MRDFEEINDGTLFKRGFVVPEGSVNLAWTKTPEVNPANNLVSVDLTQISESNLNPLFGKNHIAYANQLGYLEDRSGNQIWTEEYPVVSDFFNVDSDTPGDDISEEHILPYMHVSRFFHLEYLNLFPGRMEEYDGKTLKVLDAAGRDYTNELGEKLYRIYIVGVEADIWQDANEMPMRVYVFFDTKNLDKELYLVYNKIEIDNDGHLYNYSFTHKELINARPYHKYVPEESDVADHVNSNQKIYTTKPTTLKQKLLNLPYSDHQGWTIQVPRKAIPDPRIFQLFRWRLACEITQPKTPNTVDSNDIGNVTTINAGVVVSNTAGENSTRANFLFYQMNRTDYNFSKTRFINPLKSSTYSDLEQRQAEYWHVDFDTITPEELSQFDILVWAPAAGQVSVSSEYLNKINHFVEESGGTFILETSGSTAVTNFRDVEFTAPILADTGAQPAQRVSLSSVYLHESEDLTSSFRTLWNQFPPSLRDLMNNYENTSNILGDGRSIAGWKLEDSEKQKVSAYSGLSNINSQYISTAPSDFDVILNGKDTANVDRPVLISKSYSSGGSIYISSSRLFEDHMFKANGQMISRTLQLKSIDLLPTVWLDIFNPINTTKLVAPEMKLRFNIAKLAVVFKSPRVTSNSQVVRNPDRDSVTVYSDWHSDWTINPGGEVLDASERDRYNFVFENTKPTDLQPTWQRTISELTPLQILKDIIQKVDPEGEDPALNSISTAEKRYTIIVTNPLVQVKETKFIDDNTKITAWTNAFSPKFHVPAHIDKYSIRDEIVKSIGVGEGRRVYPPKSFNLQVTSKYLKQTLATTELNVKFRLSADVSRVIHVKKETEYGEVFIPNPDTTERVWVPEGPSAPSTVRTEDSIIYWGNVNSSAIPAGSQSNWRIGLYPYNLPNNIRTWGDSFWGSGDVYNYPYFVRHGRIDVGSATKSGHTLYHDVINVQAIMNQAIFYGHISGSGTVASGPLAGYPSGIAENGIYSQETKAAVSRFQQWKKASTTNGVIDSETWGLLGYYILGLNGIPGWRNQASKIHQLAAWVADAQRYIPLPHISDGSNSSISVRFSRYVGGPNTIRQGYLLGVNKVGHPYATPGGQFKIFKLGISPLYNGINVDHVNVGRNVAMTKNGFEIGNPGRISPRTAPAGGWIEIPFNEREADTVLFALNTSVQKDPSLGTCRFLGVRNVAIHVRRTRSSPGAPGAPGKWEEVVTPGEGGRWETIVTSPGFERIYTVTSRLDGEFTTKLKVGEDTTFSAPTLFAQLIQNLRNADMTPYKIGDTVSQITFVPASFEVIDNPLFEPSSIEVTYNNVSNSNSTMNIKFDGYGVAFDDTQYIKGPLLGDGGSHFYTMNEDREIEPYPHRYGWVSKTDGIKILCDHNGRPIGIPSKAPSESGENPLFTNIYATATGIDQTVRYGFYDISSKEWITNTWGYPSMSYYDYVRRGPNNVYLAVQTDYELETHSNLPPCLDPVSRPFRWLMPVYGVSLNTNSKIGFGEISPDLTAFDLWPVPIRAGSFVKRIDLPSKSEVSMEGLTSDYQGSFVYAFYSIAEVDSSAYSKLFGRPFMDIRDETPILLSTNEIKVRRGPVLLVQEPTNKPALYDPWRPHIKIEKRASLNDPWEEILLKDIRDYNCQKGIFILREPLESNDPRLVRVSYTSTGNVFNYKGDISSPINLNPFLAKDAGYVDKPLYIYIKPRYLMSPSYNIIDGTVSNKTVHTTLNPSIFSPSNPEYDPLAIPLGIMYSTSSFDIDDLHILDSRSRGGGLPEEVIANMTKSEQNSFLDYEMKAAGIYQNGGFVIIRLPENVVDKYTKREVEAVIERNLPAGIAYKLESFDGEDLGWN